MELLIENLNIITTLIGTLLGSGGMLAYFKWNNDVKTEFRDELRNEISQLRERQDMLEEEYFKYRKKYNGETIKRKSVENKLEMELKRTDKLERKVNTLLQMVNSLRLKMDMSKITLSDV